MYIPESVIGFICGCIVTVAVLVIIGMTAGKKK